MVLAVVVDLNDKRGSTLTHLPVAVSAMPAEPHHFLAVDPGLANTAAVEFIDEMIVEAWCISTEAQGPRPEFGPVMDRAREIADRLLAIARELAVAEVVIESYRDIPGRLRGARDRWTTPAVCAYIAAILAVGGFPVVWQDPEMVGMAYGRLRAQWKAGYHGLIEGDDILQRRGTANEHVRAAASHGVARLDSLRSLGRMP
jgi:hypothetical protein